jgi:thioredoxin-like negative regulator of GroEL
MSKNLYFILFYIIHTCLTFNFESNIINLNETNFQNTIDNNKKGILVLFYEPSCIFSQKFFPKYNKIAKDYKDKINFGVVNGNENSNLTLELLIDAYPRMLFFINGENYKFSGKRKEKRIKDFIDSCIKKSKSNLKYSKINNQ